MNTLKAIENAKLAKDLFDAFVSITKDLMIDESQIQTIDDCKWSVLGHFDAEIQHALNMQKIEKNKIINEYMEIICN